MHYVCVCKYTFLQNINDIWDVYYFPLKPQSIIYAEHSIVVKAGCRFSLIEDSQRKQAKTGIGIIKSS